MADTARLQGALGYTFRDPALLELALSHRSVGARNNERLEFLGDSILNQVIAEELYRRSPVAREGELSRMRASLVKGDTLADVATEIGLGDFLRLGAGERKTGGHRRRSILADALEAVFGAVLLDGESARCRACILALFDSRLDTIAAGVVAKDAKTQLQEYLQGRAWPLPEYELLEMSGKDHQKSFRVACHLRGPGMVTEGSGSSRRRAEQAAARDALQRLANDGD